MRAPCPTEQELLAFHLGTLTEDKVDAITDHLETCRQCEAVVERLDGAVDPILSALRKPVPASSSMIFGSSLSKERGPDLTARENWPNLPGYEILEALGRGGMGVVYKARQLRLNRLVALKRFRSNRDREMVRSRIEAETLSRLQHPNIVQIHEIVEHDGETYLALELVEGGPLGAKLVGKPQPPRETADLLETVARAVHYAHQHGIVHRDLKPANILIADCGLRIADSKTKTAEAPVPSFFQSAIRNPQSAIPKIADFGVAKRLTVDSGETREGDVIGTPAYMAPEQASGKVEGIGPPTDVYSLGAILYEMLTGRVPLQGPTTLETLILVRTEEPVPPRRLVPRIPHDLETICLKCLEKEPKHRYVTAEALANDLRRFLDGEPILARPTPAWERAWKWARRRPVVAALSAALVFMTVFWFLLVVWQWRLAEATATNEAAAKKDAQGKEQREKRARLQLEKLSAAMSINEGVTQCEGGEVGRGLLWLVRALERADRAGDADLERVARFNLASWEPYFVHQRALCQHRSWVPTVAISPDGRTGLTASFDTSAQLWDIATGQPRGKLQHKLPVYTAVFSPDGTKVLTGVNDYPNGPTSEAQLWDATTCKPLLPPQPPVAGRVLFAAFTPDGQSFLLVCGEEARIWRTADGQPLGVPIKHPRSASPRPDMAPTLSAALSPDGKTLATGGEDSTVRFWDTATGLAKGEPIQAVNPVTALAYSPDGGTLVLGCLKGEVYLWDVAKDQQRGPILHNAGWVLDIAFSADSQMVATGGLVREVDPLTEKPHKAGGEARIWQTATGNPVGSALLHPDAVHSLAFSPEGRLLLTGCEDTQARFFVVATGLQIGKALPHGGTVMSVTFSRDGRTAFTSPAGAGNNQMAQLWDLAPERTFARPVLQASAALAVAFSRDGRLLLTGGNDNTARLYDADTGRLTAALPPTEGPIILAAFSPDGKSFLTCSNPYNGRQGFPSITRLWDLQTRSERRQLCYDGWIYAAAFGADSRTVLLSPRGRSLQFWDTETARVTEGETPRGEEFFDYLDVSRDGRMILGADHQGMRIWDWQTHRELYAWPQASEAALFFPAGDKVLSMWSGHSRVWSLAGGHELPPAPFQPVGGISRAAFSPDGQMIVTSGPDGMVRLWDVTTGKPLGPPLARDGSRAIAFSPDGRRVAAAGKHGRVSLWDLPRPLGGDVERLRLWIELRTGLELDNDDAIRPLSPEVLEVRRRRLEELERERNESGWQGS